MSNEKLIQKIIIKIFNNNLIDNYTLVKLPTNFPNINLNSDLDIFCNSSEKLIGDIKSLLKDFIIKKKIKLKKTKLNDTHIHIDIFSLDNVRLIRFDIYSRLPKFFNINIKEYFFDNVIKNSKKTKFMIEKDLEVNIFLPDFLDDLAIRYIEYFEYFWTGTNKDWHLELIKSKLKKEDYANFSDYLHSIINFPLNPEFKFIHIMQTHKNKLAFKYYIKKILKKIFN
jgi:hypothetical protein